MDKVYCQAIGLATKLIERYKYLPYYEKYSIQFVLGNSNDNITDSIFVHFLHLVNDPAFYIEMNNDNNLTVGFVGLRKETINFIYCLAFHPL